MYNIGPVGVFAVEKETEMTSSIGYGRDLHALYEGHELILGGVPVPFSKGFDTHSDGDVLSHAIVDALAGAIAEGDLGTWFPEDDPAAQNARSLDFVARMCAVVHSRGYEIEHLDSFVILGPVRLRPYIDEMRNNVAKAMGVPLGHVSVKARSNDMMGLEGEGRACSAQAVVLLSHA